jgi:uncharacterized repeat protein (TIGR03837 family)
MTSPHTHPQGPSWLWDVFCTVIDNHGDLGVCWRLARQLRDAGHRIRLWVDDASALTWMAPGALEGLESNITIMAWPQAHSQYSNSATPPMAHEPAHVWVEAFGCTIPEGWVAAQFKTRQTQQLAPPVWVNLEYLSAEAWVPRMHGLPSPVLHGPAQGATKWFYYPGLTPDTGGLLREADLLEQQAAFASAQCNTIRPGQTTCGMPPPSTNDSAAQLKVTLFCYEPPALPELLAQLGPNIHLQVCAGRPTQAVQAALSAQPQLANTLQWTTLPYMPQPQFDKLLWSSHINLVRGEDSLVRALWAGKPLVWHIYPQDDNAHIAKLNAFLDWLEAPASLRIFHHRYNGLPTPQAQAPLAWPQNSTLAAWEQCIQAARQRLLMQPSLVEQLVSFVAKKL